MGNQELLVIGGNSDYLTHVCNLLNDFGCSPRQNQVIDIAECLACINVSNHFLYCVSKLDATSLEEFKKLSLAAPAAEAVVLFSRPSAEQAFLYLNEGAAKVLVIPPTKEALPTQTMEKRLAECLPQNHLNLAAPNGRKSRSATEKRLANLALVARSNSNILISGPSGSGKNYCARFIHDHSRRKGFPFVVVDCASIPDTLIESELFGHEKGVFTGAANARTGLLREADRGTVVLLGIEDFSLNNQAKLLRALQEREERPVGSQVNIPIDIRVIATSRIDLRERVAKGEFREDLLYRLNTIHVSLPSLAERREDIPGILANFLDELKLAKGLSSEIRLSAQAFFALCCLPWPGNIRQLRNVIFQAAAFANFKYITEAEIAKAINSPVIKYSFRSAKQQLEADYLSLVMKKARGHVPLAANMAGRNRTEFYRLLKRNSMSPTSWQPPVERNVTAA
ncbi:two-component system, NtrC family, response regulator GlrR [Noviherbaspirillum humi]|uniref:Two-component system, NtrC family, response regulator GlrR n=1 Tax=Noviherbaspirillum humi TaxID=1688639 RepID=A0A239M5M8_9BURK|nr:sigma-54 dependent transcriptional regulator [Noviherbaspirillum humi]SNT37149.1 two-component system, NtrC family, response regulator GlrR [Noviherbaspirillum humi]